MIHCESSQSFVFHPIENENWSKKVKPHQNAIYGKTDS